MEKWFAIQVVSGCENSVKKELTSRVEKHGFQDKILNIYLPEDDVEVETKKGIIIKKEKRYPGYIFLLIDVEDKEIDKETWYLVKSTYMVTNFLGGSKPVAISNSEIEKMFNYSKTIFTDYNESDQIIVKSGPYKDKIYTVSKVDKDANTITVYEDLLGRLVEITLNFKDIEIY